MAADGSEDPSFPYWRMTLRFGRMAMRSSGLVRAGVGPLRALAAEEVMCGMVEPEPPGVEGRVV